MDFVVLLLFIGVPS